MCVPRKLQHLREVRAAQIGHAEQAETALRIVMNGVNRHDMRMLKASQGLRFVTEGFRDFQRDLTIRKLKLLSEIDSRESAPAKLGNELKSREDVADIRKTNGVGVVFDMSAPPYAGFLFRQDRLAALSLGELSFEREVCKTANGGRVHRSGAISSQERVVGRWRGKVPIADDVIGPATSGFAGTRHSVRLHQGERLRQSCAVCDVKRWFPRA